MERVTVWSMRSCAEMHNAARQKQGKSLAEKREFKRFFQGKVPEDMELLQTLPGVGRKTANVVMAVAFHKPAMPVDTHVFRVSNRIGLVNNTKTPLETEKQLVKNIPAEILSTAHHWLILHGRYVCLARKPKCEECGIRQWCRFFQSRR